MKEIIDLKSLVDGYVGFGAYQPTDEARQLEAQGWEVWLKTVFPFAFSKPFAPFHRKFWDLWWEICLKIRDKKYIEPEKLTLMLLWGRALAKSSSGTPSSLMKGAIVGQIYSLYISEVFDQAAEHLDNVRYLIMHPNSRLTEFYPHLTLDSKGTSKLGLKGKDAEGIFITTGGCVFRAFGLDSSGRGIGLAGRRPDDYNIDDVDNLTHSIAVSTNIIKKVTRNFLMTQDLIGEIPVTTKVLQNLIIEHGFVNQVYTHRTDALADRTVIGVVNTFEKIDIQTDVDEETGKVRHTILPSSIPTWEAVSLDVAQRILNLLGLEGFMAECQNDFALGGSGRVIPEYDEERQIITWSQFERVFGTREVPSHWKIKAGLDVGYSEGQHPHYSGWVFLATSAMNSPLPNKYFLVKARSFKATSIDDQAETIAREIGAMRSQVNEWQMSHERTGEMLTLNQKYNFPFYKFKYYKPEDGVAQWRHLSRPDKSIPHPFKKDELADGEWKLGCPNLFYIVDDDQLAMPRDDNGLRLFREQVSTWEYVPVKITESGQTAQKPSKINDDLCDAFKGIIALWGARATPKTLAERQEEARPTHLRLDVINREVEQGLITPEQRAHRLDMRPLFDAMREMNKPKKVKRR